MTLLRRRRAPLPQLVPGPHPEWGTYLFSPDDPPRKTARWRRCPARALFYETEVRCIRKRHDRSSFHLIHP